jgi:hypothetical protein
LPLIWHWTKAVCRSKQHSVDFLKHATMNASVLENCRAVAEKCQGQKGDQPKFG